jgi:nucleotide-binding universal stress UspA family protein
MDPKRILWPTDFSNNSEKALPYVQSLGEKYQTEVHVLYVIPELVPEVPWCGDFDKSRVDQIHQWEKKKAEDRLSQICENHLEGCPLYIRDIAIGDPADEILKLILKEEIDLVVMATRGRKDRFQFGSVAEKVVKNATVPVITTPVK